MFHTPHSNYEFTGTEVYSLKLQPSSGIFLFIVKLVITKIENKTKYHFTKIWLCTEEHSTLVSRIIKPLPGRLFDVSNQSLNYEYLRMYVY
jgi:hypothetical protein